MFLMKNGCEIGDNPTKWSNLGPTPIFDNVCVFVLQLSKNPRTQIVRKIVKSDQKWRNLGPTPIFDHFLYLFFNFKNIRGPKFQEKLSKMINFEPNTNCWSCFVFVLQLSKNLRTQHLRQMLKNDQTWSNLDPILIFIIVLYLFANFQKIRGPQNKSKFQKFEISK